MAKKSRKSASAPDESKELWISPRFSLKTEGVQRAWGNRETGNNPGSARFLELADIALGLKKPEIRKKRATSASAHITAKTEPYSR
jgi:hypothetical protein